jgi:hypothetical protein
VLEDPAAVAGLRDAGRRHPRLGIVRHRGAARSRHRVRRRRHRRGDDRLAASPPAATTARERSPRRPIPGFTRGPGPDDDPGSECCSAASCVRRWSRPCSGCRSWSVATRPDAFSGGGITNRNFRVDADGGWLRQKRAARRSSSAWGNDTPARHQPRGRARRHVACGRVGSVRR